MEPGYVPDIKSVDAKAAEKSRESSETFNDPGDTPGRNTQIWISRTFKNASHQCSKPDSFPVNLKFSNSGSKNSTPMRLTRSNQANIDTPEWKLPTKCNTPRSIARDISKIKAEHSNLIVGVRVRPLLPKEELDKDMQPVVSVTENKVQVLTDYGQAHSFSYDFCFSSHEAQDVEQKRLYSTLAKPLLSKALEGFNTCLFAYGQTGSGKSYSVMGMVGCNAQLHEHAGMIPQFCYDLFDKLQALQNALKEVSIQVEISFFEIYREKIQDLLCMSKTKKSLRVREHPQTGPYVEDLTHYAVNSFEEVQRWLAVGNRQRATAATSSNERSSRSHAIFTITLSQAYPIQEGNFELVNRKKSKINFIDLAGSERVASANSVGERREEGLTINQSLLTLGRVITALSENTFVPYRESILTWLLKESLGGDSKTAMLATISPCAAHCEETLSTLRYACQARMIINVARINEDPSARLIRNLQEQIKVLEKRVCEQENRISVDGLTNHDSSANANTARVRVLEAEINKLKECLYELQTAKNTSWQMKISEAESKCVEAEQKLAGYGVASNKDPQQPCLVNVNQDPLLSGTLFFPLNPGKNWVGPTTILATPTTTSIQLSGGAIKEKHCCFENSNGILKLVSRAETYVNGQLVPVSGVRLFHGDRVIIGGSHFFHVHLPSDALRQPSSKVYILKISYEEKYQNFDAIKAPDFETAYDELQRIQDERLKTAIQEAEEKTRNNFLNTIEEIRKEAALEISLQRHSYEDEIALLNRVIEERCNKHEEPNLIAADRLNNQGAWIEVENMLQEAKLSLERSSEDRLNLTTVQNLVDEANAICKQYEVPFSFQMKHGDLLDSSRLMIQVKNILHSKAAWLSFDEMQTTLLTLKETVVNSLNFPQNIFDDKEFLDVDDELIYPNIKEKLEKLRKRLDNSLSVDDSQLSIESPNSNGLSSTTEIIRENNRKLCNRAELKVCKDLLSSIVPGDNISIFVANFSFLLNALSNVNTSSLFLIPFLSHSLTLISVFPVVVQNLTALAETDTEMQEEWLKSAMELCISFQKNLHSVLQVLDFDVDGVRTAVKDAQTTLDNIAALYFEISAVCSHEIVGLRGISSRTALNAFLEANLKIHKNVISQLCTMANKIANPPLHDRLPKAFVDSERSLTKAAHDIIDLVHVILEKSTDRIVNLVSSEMELEVLHSMFHQRIEVLLRISVSLKDFFSSLAVEDIVKMKYSSATLEVQLSTYLNLLDAADIVRQLMSELAFNTSMMHKILTEKARSVGIRRRNRTSSCSPITANYVCLQEEQVIDSAQEAPRFAQALTPLKSSIKSPFKSTAKSVRFTVSDLQIDENLI